MAERRAHIGLRLFLTMLASDQDLASHLDETQSLRLLVVHSAGAGEAGGWADKLRQAATRDGQPRIGALPVEVATATVPELADTGAVAGIFLLDELPQAELQRLIDFGRQRGIIVWSPVEGHVERGVTGGLNIGVRVLPFVNRTALEAADIQLKPFFLKVAKIHDD